MERLSGFVVTLEKDTREEDAGGLISALCQIRGIASVIPVTTDVKLTIAKEQAKAEFKRRLYEHVLGGME